MIDPPVSLTINATMRELMTSAAVDIYDKNGKKIRCRALLDTCSTANFMTEELASVLQLPKRKLNIPVGALNDMSTTTKHTVSATITSIYDDYEKHLHFLTIPRIADKVPSEPLPRENIDIPGNIRLADPEFHTPNKIDLLIGLGPTLAMLCIGQIKLTRDGNDLILQKMRLGWTIGGSVPENRKTKTKCLFSNIEQDIAGFWEIEEGSTSNNWSNEEKACEEHFKQHTTRDERGRYIVALPFKSNIPNIGESYRGAEKRFLSLSRKLNANEDLRRQYTAVIDEYQQLGHMSEVKHCDNDGFYLPHHAVIKETSATTKVRVVFDGSAKSSSGISLNDALMVGPTIQDDIFTLTLRFRLHNYVLTADVEKMYRQFTIRKEDRQFQRILWKNDDGISTYELNTVTFGLSASPYLAIRCLHQLADDEGHEYPRAAASIKRDMYVDELLTGTNTIEEARQLRRDICKLLAHGGLHLRQWASNDPEVLDGLPESELNETFTLDKERTLKTLGIIWQAKGDCIKYTVQPVTVNATVTKRQILSDIAKIFDPLGLLGPVILYAKRMMQKLWLLKIHWDESVPQDINYEWATYCEQLTKLNDWSYDRKAINNDAIEHQLHGFCDASEKGYGACVYIVSKDHRGDTQCILFCSKSRVAPLKTLTIPRLELCAAHLLAQLVTRVKNAIGTEFGKTILWSDSMITLHWINTAPHILKTFVSNRVANIQQQTNRTEWRHVPSKDNPADMLSRGQLPNEFLENDLWKNGPHWLKYNEDQWPTTPNLTTVDDSTENKKVSCFVTTSNCDWFSNYSSYRHLKRIIAYCLRFRPRNVYKGDLSSQELHDAETKIISLIQANAFKDELRNLNKGTSVHNKSRLKSLDPFIDKKGIMRVGGRLKNAEIPYEQQHPAILPRSHHVTNLIVKNYHEQHYHSGIQTTLYAIRRQYWPIDGRNQVRRTIRKCIRCFRANPSTAEYAMGNLPAIRITQARPFSNVGVDYCGPFYIKEKKYRNRGKIKIYVAVFVCLVIKATHLEVVSDLTTEGFLGALRRFIARRGKPHTISSDNGTNFVGANNELSELYSTINSAEHRTKTTSFLAEQGIEWRFIPPLSPNFGGLWESTVKVFKHHFKRVIVNELFTFEEFNTFAIEIEAILNSRPLTPLSVDPNDILALTPGHFLIGDSLTSLPASDYSNTPTNRLSRWQHIQKVRQDFWTRWSKEYLNELNIRSKWATGKHAIKEGTIVLLKDDNAPPMQWPLGRITKVHPGADGVIRTVTIKTASSTFDRNVRRLAPLPIDEKNII